MSEIFREAGRVARDAAEGVLCSAGGINRVTNDIAGKLNPLYRGSALERFRDRVSDGLQRFCPLPPNRLPPLPGGPEFSGGQCPGVFYGVFYSTLEQQFDDDGVTIIEVAGERSTAGNGPIVSVTSEPVGDPTAQGFQTYETTFVSQGGSNERVILTGSVRATGIVRVDRADGQPDDCGDPPPPTPEPDPNPPSDPRPPSTTVNIDLPDVGPTSVVFAPVVGIVYADIDGSIRVPVSVTVDVGGIRPEFDIDFTVNLSDPESEPEPVTPELPDGPDGRPELPDCPEPEECGVEPEVEGPDEELEDERDAKGREITGAIVLTVPDGSRPRQTELFQDDGGSVWVPYLGLLTFIYEAPGGGLVYSMDIPIKRLRQTVAAPRTGLSVVGASVTYEQGWEGEVFYVIPPSKC